MVDNRNKRKKHHDKDKYYRLAKEQGLRSRAAFKLVQINKKFPLLQKCQAGVLDLCAAPGGWTQIAARTCPKHVPIVAVDILPIRSTGHANVTTIVGDITTDKCKSDIQKAVRDANIMQQSVDLVLHDGAPNIGAEYGKDAYEQNELTIHALRCATQHLKAGGHFITKVYRSRDYASLQWLLQQLFGQVQALKPAASRSQSAEIFLICQHYKAPAKLDPRLLDPKYIFEEVAGDSTGGVISSGSNAAAAGVSIFHKNWDKPRRKRGGYDLEHLDATMRHIESVQHFVAVSSLQAAIQILSTSTGLAFQCEMCKEKDDKDEDGDDDDDTDIDDNNGKCLCAFYKNHPLTTPEIKECVSDLQVLNKSDFKSLLTWRTKMQDAALAKRDIERDDKNESDAEASDASAPIDDDEEEIDSDQEEQNIQNEITEMRQRRQREKKRQKKKEREAAAKRRRRAALGMDLNAIDVPEHDKVFSLATITSKGDLEAAAEVNLDRVSDEQLFGGEDSDEEVVIGKEEDKDEELDEEERMRRRERDLEEAYSMYLESTKDAAARKGTKTAKRSKKLMRQKVMEEAAEDQEMAMVGAETLDYNTRTYADMLQGPHDSDDEEYDSSTDEEDDDGYDADPMTPEEHAQKQRGKRQKRSDAQKAGNPLIHNFADEPASVKTARWFSNPVFSLMGKAAEKNNETAKGHDESESSDEEVNDLDSDDSAAGASNQRGKKSKKTKGKSGLAADEVLASIPKTDKQIRHEKRLKALEREERKKARRAKRLGEAEGDFELAPANEESDNEAATDDLAHLSESQKKKVLEARQLIKAGMGKIADDGDEDIGIEIVASEETRPLPVMDDRKYDSDHVDYDSDDYAQTLALGTMMLRRSKEKALVDASYNRYAWNDPEDLPEWFVDDEAKHYRPQLPIPPTLVAKMKERMMALSAKPIKKVAEARARKNKRAKAKLVAAKKQAEAVANSSEMSEAMKLKAISKALRGQETKKPGKSYVVAKKGRAGQQGGKGVKLVDKRMKSDKRGLERAEKRRKKGSKRKRSHK